MTLHCFAIIFNEMNSYFKLLLLKVVLQAAESWVELVFTELYSVFFTRVCAVIGYKYRN